MDFTLKTYRMLLTSLKNAHYHFQTFEEFLTAPMARSVVLRHDVDLLPYNSLEFARIQHHWGIRGVYYFRAVPQSWDEQVIREIADMGHEVGYHYECLTTSRGDYEEGIRDFEKNLAALRRLVPVATICMHGSPASKYDSKDLWKKHSYQEYGIIGEPYLSIDFCKVLYLTDTGRRWDGGKVSVRDKVQSGFDLCFHTTDEIRAAAEAKMLPDQIMFTFHPQRWNDNPYLWTRELVAQNAKNVLKRYIIMRG
jgi:hypothetical protein